MAKLLVVDDNESICQLIHDFFGDLKGHTVFAATKPADAPDLVREHDPDLALLDIMMPGIHGIDLLKQLREIKPDLKAIMITAVDDEDIAREAMDRGAVDYVTKPLDLNYLDTQVTFQLMS
jgi:two-component system, response regulator, stage 0 sporulation protein F